MKLPPLPAPAAGKREQRKAERRAAIIEIAARSFLEHGYDGTSMSAIAEEMGGSKGTLWSYFTSKEQLFEAFIDTSTSALRAELTAMLDPTGHPRDTLEAFARRFLDRITAPDALRLYRLVIGESERFPQLGRIFYERAPGTTEPLLADFISHYMDTGALRRDNANHAARMIMSLCAGGLHMRALWRVAEVDAGDIAAEAVRIVDLFLRTYAPAASA